jgi:hypothetical protein
MKLKIVTVALLVVLLGGCAELLPGGLAEKLSPQPGAEGVELTREQNGKFLAFVGPKLQHTAPFLGVADTNYFALRSWIDTRNREVVHQLYVAASYYGDPYRWDGVRDKDNTALRLIPISRNQITCDYGCSYADEFAAALTEDYLRAHKKGLTVIFTAANNKTLEVTVPGELVIKELVAVDTVRDALAKGQPVAAATPAPAAAPAPAATPAPAPAATTAPAPSGR